MMRLFAVIVLLLAGLFSVVMLGMCSVLLADRSKATVGFRLLMFLAAVSNAAVVLLYLIEWNH